MFKFFKKKKTIQAVPILDLRNYTPEALSKINKIRAVAVLIIPEDPTPEFSEAFAQIQCEAVASTIRVKKDIQLKSYNGILLLGEAQLQGDSIIMLNGIFVIPKCSSNTECIMNGIVLKNKSANVNFASVNGILHEMEFDEDKVKFYSNDVDINADYIRNIEPETLIASGKSIKIEEDVTEELLTENGVKFFAGFNITCPKCVKGYMLSHSCIGKGLTDY